MKKLIAILAVFAFMTAALFAQDEGSWSVGGSGRIGTAVNFLPLELSFSDSDADHAQVKADGWDQDTNNVRGGVDLTYRKGGLSTGFGINQHDGVTAKVSYNGENWQFSAEQNLRDLLLSGANVGRGTLWGNYTFQVLNGIKLEASVSRTGQQWWNVTDIFGDTFTHTKWGNNNGRGVGTAFGMGDGLNSASYLLLDASPMAGLNLGFVIPNMFVYSPTEGNWNADLQEEALRYTVFGGKFVSGPIQVGLQFALKGQQATFFDKDGKETNTRDDLRSGLYISGQYTINSQMNAALEFRGLFGTQAIVSKDGDAVVPAGTTDAQYKDSSDFGIGAQFNFNQGPFGVNVRLRYRDTNSAVTHVGDSFYFRVRPYYDLVEGFLRFQLTTEFTFKDVIDGEATAKATDGKNVWVGVMDYTIQPELYFNFLGTGAGSWGTGFAARYRITGPAGYFEPTKGHNTANFLELVFNWSF